MNTKLAEMLSYRRPHGSLGEQEFVRTYLLAPHVCELAGPMQNVIITVGSGSRTLFSCHTDTVHRMDGRQKVLYDAHKQEFFKNDGTPLGADDAAGVWLMLEMIEAKVPGTYVFHRGEERGGVGSSWMANNRSEWLANFDRAIAFDRKDTFSVISHQGYGRCSSDTFANALAEALNVQSDEFMYTSDDTGIFTDTANYVDHIPECTNISCGYYREHTPEEYLDAAHLMLLRDACIHLDWEALPTVRDPFAAAEVSRLEDLEDYSYDEVLALCIRDPDLVADMIYFDYCRAAATTILHTTYDKLDYYR